MVVSFESMVVVALGSVVVVIVSVMVLVIVLVIVIVTEVVIVAVMDIVVVVVTVSVPLAQSSQKRRCCIEDCEHTRDCHVCCRASNELTVRHSRL